MTRLGQPVSRWADSLALVPEALARAITPWLDRLLHALGPLGGSPPPGSGEPDGFGGLARRGPYQRLLSSEWLLADELPDEFLRRAAASEHTFLELQRRAPSGGRATAVLFDAGPSQLGVMRLAHVALLVALGRRAREAGARFAWGVLQSERDALDERLDARALLAARSLRQLVLADVARARARALEHGAGELWLVGDVDTPTRAAAIGAHAISVASGERELRVEVTRKGAASRGVALSLPSDWSGAALLGDPGTTPQPNAKHARDAAIGAPMFSGDGHRLLVRSADKLTAFHVPHSAAIKAGKPLIVHLPEGELFAVGSIGRVLAAFALRGAHVLASSRGAPHLHPPREAVAAIDGLPFRVEGVGQAGYLHLRWMTLDGLGRLVAWSHAPTLGTRIHSDTIHAFAVRRDGIVCVGTSVALGAGRGRLLLLPKDWGPDAAPAAPKELAVFDFAPGARVFFGPDAAGHASGAVAVETGARAWTLFDAVGAPRALSPADGCEVIGLARAAPSSPVLGLVVLDAERRQASHLLPDGVKEIARAPRPVASACVSRAFGHLAWRAESGEIAVVDIVSGANLVTLATGAKDGA